MQRQPTRADVVRLTALLDETMRKRGIKHIDMVDIGAVSHEYAQHERHERSQDNDG